ncbi:hypothetical protein BGZ50_000269 [Haplosporangium sp. Z 11]|nr:hypothetical protein BGZ50_000269 [Haplosporangium sp. Z 11]
MLHESDIKDMELQTAELEIKYVDEVSAKVAPGEANVKQEKVNEETDENYPFVKADATDPVHVALKVRIKISDIPTYRGTNDVDLSNAPTPKRKGIPNLNLNMAWRYMKIALEKMKQRSRFNDLIDTKKERLKNWKAAQEVFGKVFTMSAPAPEITKIYFFIRPKEAEQVHAYAKRIEMFSALLPRSRRSQRK